MKQIIAVGKVSEEEKAIFDYLGRFFGVQTFELGLDVARGLMSAIKPNLIMIKVTELMTAPVMTLEDIIKENSPTPVITYGHMDELIQFETKHNGVKVEHLSIPTDENTALKMVCSKLRVNPDKMLAKAAGKKKIMVIDDDATSLRSLKTMLDNDYDVSVANSGKKAFEMMEKSVPALVLLDNEMPEMNGKQVLEKIRSTEGMKDLPVIFVTGISDVNYIKELMPLRPSGYLLKPVTPNVLLTEIDKVLKS